MTWGLRRLSLTGTTKSTKSTKPISIKTDTSSSSIFSPPSPSTNAPPSPTTPLRAPSPSDASPPSNLPQNQIKRTDNRLRRLSAILSRPHSGGSKRLSTDASADAVKTISVTPRLEAAQGAPSPNFVEFEETKSTGNRGTRRSSRVEQVDPALFVIEELQHATEKMRFAQNTLTATSEEPELETEDLTNSSASDEEVTNTSLSQSQWVKSTLSIISLDKPHCFEALYELHEALGSGNFSTVYNATRTSDGAKFAVKKITKTSLGGKEDLIRAEIDIHSALDHSNIIKVVEVFETPAEWNIVLQLAPGGELFAHLVENGGLGERQGKALAKSILHGVSFFHKKYVIHRDLKPENILLYGPDSTEVFIADFGLSALTNPSDILTKQCGSLEYAAPELLAGKGYNLKADMWSIGVIIYTIICGYQPFQGSSDSRVARTIISGTFDFHNSHWCFVSEEAKDLIRGLLEVNPAKRLSAQEALKHPWFA